MTSSRVRPAWRCGSDTAPRIPDGPNDPEMLPEDHPEAPDQLVAYWLPQVIRCGMDNLYELSYHRQQTADPGSSRFKLCAQAVDNDTPISRSSSKTREDLDLMLGIVGLKFDDLGDTTDGPAENLPKITLAQVMALNLSIESFPAMLT